MSTAWQARRYSGEYSDTAKILRLSEDLPLVIEIVDSEEHIQDFLPALGAMMSSGLITLEKVRVVQYGLPDDRYATGEMIGSLLADERPARFARGGMPEWSNGLDSKSSDGLVPSVGSNPTPSAILSC